MNLQNDGEVNIVTPNQTNNIGISTTVPSIPTVTASFRYNPIDGCVTIFSNISGKVNNIFKKGSSYGTSSNSNSSSGSSSGSSTIRRKERILSLLLPVDISTNMTNQTACEDNSMQSTPRVATTVIIDNIAPISGKVINIHVAEGFDGTRGRATHGSAAATSGVISIDSTAQDDGRHHPQHINSNSNSNDNSNDHDHPRSRVHHSVHVDKLYIGTAYAQRHEVVTWMQSLLGQLRSKLLHILVVYYESIIGGNTTATTGVVAAAGGGGVSNSNVSFPKVAVLHCMRAIYHIEPQLKLLLQHQLLDAKQHHHHHHHHKQSSVIMENDTVNEVLREFVSEYCLR